MTGQTNASISRSSGGTHNIVKEFNYYATHLDELQGVLNMHYLGIIDLSTLWSVGDTMENIPLSVLSATTLGDGAQDEQNIDLVILDFNSEPLTPNTSMRAAVTLGQKDCLSATFRMTTSTSTSTNYTNTNIPNWLNTTYYNALPTDLSKLIKPVNKLYSYYYKSSSTWYNYSNNQTNCKCWLATNYEIFGSTYGSIVSVTDGQKYYAYYNSQSNRIKCLGKGGTPIDWWTNAHYNNNTDNYFVYCSSDGSRNLSVANQYKGIAPCFCI